jgi:hypothetical protein
VNALVDLGDLRVIPARDVAQIDLGELGTFTLTPSDNNPPTTTTSFSQASYTGTFIVKDGAGAFAKATGTGTLSCSTNDAVHLSCRQKGKVITPAPKTSSRK